VFEVGLDGWVRETFEDDFDTVEDGFDFVFIDWDGFFGFDGI
jgi:hypothetical protein